MPTSDTTNPDSGYGVNPLAENKSGTVKAGTNPLKKYKYVSTKYPGLKPIPVPKDFPKPIPFTPRKFEDTHPISWGEGFLSTLNNPATFIREMMVQNREYDLAKEAIIAKYTKGIKQYDGLKSTPEYAAARDKAMATPEYKAIDKDYKYTAANAWEKANAWQHGKATLSGADWFEKLNPGYHEALKNFAKDSRKEGSARGEALASISTFLSDFVLGEIVVDPTTYVPFADVVVPVKAVAKGTQYMIKGAKEAALGGKVSTQYLANSTGDIVKAAEGATPFRPNVAVTNQYSAKSVIPENLIRYTGPMAEKLAKLDTRVANNFYYSMSPAQPTAANVIASGLEAGYKAAATTFLAGYTKRSLEKMAKAETNLAYQTVTAAPKAVDNAGVEVDIQPFVPHVTPEASYVYDGKNLHRFDNEQEATAWVADSKKVPKDTSIAVTRGQAPIVDTVPLSMVDSVVKAIPADTAVAKDAKATLNTINKLVAKAKGTRDISNTVKRIDKIINRVDTGALPVGISNAIRELLKKKGDAFELLRAMNTSTVKKEIDIVRAIVSRTIVGKDGSEKTILELMKARTWASLGPETKKKIIAQFETFLQDSAGTQAAKLNELTDLVGSDVAKQIADAGLLNPAKTPSATALQSILNGIPSLVNKSYDSMAELAAGLKSGDIIDLKILEKLAKAIDPESAAIRSVEAAAAQTDEYKRLANILIEKGKQTVLDTERRLAIADSAVLMTAQGLSAGDVIGAYAEQRLRGNIDALPEAVEESRMKASANIAAWANDTDTASKLQRTYESINRGLAGQFEYIEQIQNSPDLFQGISTLGDLAVRSTDKAFQAETKAALIKQLTASTEAKMLGNMMGLIRKDLTRKLEKRANAGKTTQRTPLPSDLFDEFLTRGRMMDDALLSVLGSRFTYRKTAATAKGEKHYVYSSISEIANIFDSTEGRDIFIRALFPNTNKVGITKYDALSFVGISKAVQRLLESAERGAPISKDLLIKDLKSKGELQKPWSKAFKTQVDEIVNDFADHLASPKVIEALQDVHKARAIATIEDAIKNADAMASDMWTSLMNGWKANIDNGVDSSAARAQLVRDWFYKFTYTSGIFNQQNGEVAQAVFEAAAMMFVRQGKLQKLAGETGNAVNLIGKTTSKDPAEQMLAEEIAREINSMFKKKNADLTPNMDANKIPFPTEAAKSKATAKLTEAKLVYETHINARAGLTTKAEAAAWKKKFDTYQTRLDQARLEANKLGISTHHWMNGEWVPTEFYNRDLALKLAKEQENATLALDDGVLKAEVVDSKYNFPSHQKLSAPATKKLMDQWHNDNAVRSVERMKGIHEEAAQSVLDDVAEIEALGLPDAATAELIYKATIGRPYYDGEYSILTGHVTHRKLFGKQTEPRANLKGELGYTTPRQALAEQLNASTGRQNLLPIQQRAEATLMNQISNFAKTAAMISRKWYGSTRLTREDFTQAMNYAISRATPPANASADIVEAVSDLRRLMDPIFGTPETTEIVAGSVFPQLMENSLRKYGFNEVEGFVPPTNGTPKSISEYATWLPFAEMPEAIKAGTKEAQRAFRSRAEDFAASNIDPMIMVTRLAEALSFAKMEHQIITDFATRFGWKANPTIKTMEQAAREGYVKLNGVSAGTGTDLTKFLPSPEDGGLFPAEIAREFMSINREINKIYNSGKMPGFLQATMSIVGAMKATQTLLRPGHHIMNIQGDFQTAMIMGARNPADLRYALQLSKNYAGDDIKTLLGSKESKLEAQFLRAATYMEEPAKTAERLLPDGTSVPTIMVNGKRVDLDMNMLGTKFENAGIITGSHYQDDIQGLYEATMVDGGMTGAQETLRQRIVKGLGKGVRAVEQPVGTAASYYSNISRTWLAMHVIRSRSWKSMDEAIDAASLAIHKAFPTIHSLASLERKGPRVLIMYYTWLRVAHNAFIDMALNHTGAMLIPAKYQRYEAEQNGQETISLGNLWGDKSKTPGYLDYSVYGPTSKTDQGLMMHKTGALPMEIFDAWNFTYDPVYSVDENIFTNLERLGKDIGASSNPFIQRIGEGITGTDWSTGQKSQIKDSASLLDSIVGDLGFAGLLKGLNLYTPIGKGPDSRNPLTEEQRAILLQNWLFGQKTSITDTPANQKNAKIEEKNRYKSFLETRNGK